MAARGVRPQQVSHRTCGQIAPMTAGVADGGLSAGGFLSSIADVRRVCRRLCRRSTPGTGGESNIRWGNLRADMLESPANSGWTK
jgi:hypothetical protein